MLNTNAIIHQKPWLLAFLLLCSFFFSQPSLSAVESVIYFHNDIHGSPVAVTDAEGDVIWRESYKPYGERLTKQEGTESHTSWYTGKTEEAAFGIQYFGGRWYHTGSNRFMTFDPASARDNIANPLMFNRYIYANNNPYRYVDPDGNSPLDIGFFVVDGFRLGLAIYSGNTAAIQSASADFAASTIGLISPVPGVGQAIKAGRAGVKIAKVTKKTDTLQPGPFAKESIPARGPKRNFTKAEREKINDLGRTDGCHTCGSTVAGTKSDNFIPDHQPPNALNPLDEAQRLFPHCKNCSQRQAGQVTQEKKRKNR